MTCFQTYIHVSYLCWSSGYKHIMVDCGSRPQFCGSGWIRSRGAPARPAARSGCWRSVLHTATGTRCQVQTNILPFLPSGPRNSTFFSLFDFFFKKVLNSTKHRSTFGPGLVLLLWGTAGHYSLEFDEVCCRSVWGVVRSLPFFLSWQGFVFSSSGWGAQSRLSESTITLTTWKVTERQIKLETSLFCHIYWNPFDVKHFVQHLQEAILSRL